jgi:hypothetical protein
MYRAIQEKFEPGLVSMDAGLFLIRWTRRKGPVAFGVRVFAADNLVARFLFGWSDNDLCFYPDACSERESHHHVCAKGWRGMMNNDDDDNIENMTDEEKAALLDVELESCREALLAAGAEGDDRGVERAVARFRRAGKELIAAKYRGDAAAAIAKLKCAEAATAIAARAVRSPN